MTKRTRKDKETFAEGNLSFQFNYSFPHIMHKYKAHNNFLLFPWHIPSLRQVFALRGKILQFDYITVKVSSRLVSLQRDCQSINIKFYTHSSPLTPLCCPLACPPVSLQSLTISISCWCGATFHGEAEGERR